MTALLEDARSAWPFPSEPLEMGVEHGVVWAIVKAPLYGVNGYALIPAEGHPWSAGVPVEKKKYHPDDDYEFEEWATEAVLDVHGGITYGASAEKGWVGFDTAHSGDVWTGEFDYEGPGEAWSSWMGGTGWDRYWTVDLVASEAKSLARQIAAVTA